MNSQDYGWYVSLLGAFLAQSPIFLVYLIGAVIAVLRWRRHRRVSIFFLVSVAVSLIDAVVFTTVEIWLPYYLSSMRADIQKYGYYSYALNFASNLIHAIALALLTFAVFTNRPLSNRVEQ